MSYYNEKLQQISKDKLQKKAYDAKDSTVVIAGPGSGKTTILTLKIMKLLNHTIKEPQGLACITFSREAAREFEERLKKLGCIRRNNVFLGTVHSFCISEILGSFADLYNYNIPRPIKIVPAKIKQKLFDEAKEAMGYTKCKIIDMDKERTAQIIGMSEVETQSNPELIKVAKEYEARLFSEGYMDYESIIIISTKLIQEQPYVRQCLSVKYPWIIIDEYQDLGRPLHEIILYLFVQTEIKIFAVGDPDQSIYGFSGARPDYLLELYSRDDVLPIELKNNYRSNQDIIDGSEIVLNIKRNYNAMTRKDESAVYKFIGCENGLEDQYEYFTEKIFPECVENKISLEEIAVLVGYNQSCKELAIKCMDKKIPYYISKHKFERSDFVKWLEECAQWINDKTKVSFDKIYNYWENILILHKDDKFMSEKRKLQEKKFIFEILTNSAQFKTNLQQWIEYFLKNLEVKELLSNSEKLPDELENLEKMYKEVCEEIYKDYDTRKFSKIGKPENQITISTRHSSKGLEFEVVVMMGMEEGHFPGWRAKYDLSALEEENRMCFVCISRAKRICILMKSRNYIEYNYYTQQMDKKIYHASQYWKQLKLKFDER